MAESQDSILLKIQEQGDLVRKLKTAKESSEKAKRTDVQYDLEEIDRYLYRFSYICGYVPSKCDIEMTKVLGNVDFQRYKYIKRWWYHMRSFGESEIELFLVTPLPNVILKAKGTNKLIDEQVCEMICV